MSAAALEPEPARDARCEFGLCLRPAECEVVVPGEGDQVEDVLDVCGWHVEAAASWGRPQSLNAALVRSL